MKQLAVTVLASLLLATGDTAAHDERQRSAARPSGAHKAETAGGRAPQRAPEIDWRRSRSLGLPWEGRLAGGVRLPPEGRNFFTWDPVRRRQPNRPWRRFGSDRLVRTVLRVLSEFAVAHSRAPRVGVGDLSRPNGGYFGPLHASHQNGLDVDVYYPRRDRRERAPRSVAQIDRALAQDLVDRFVRAGASRVFVGPRTGLRGPRGVVEALAYHDNHMHVRFPWGEPRRILLGRSHLGRPIAVTAAGDPQGRRKILVVGCIHGTECAGIAITRRLTATRRSLRSQLWLLHNLNPDGFALGRRQNARGVDLNRNFPAEWRRIGRRGDGEYSGRRPLSERETRIARSLIHRLRPHVTIWFHQPQAIVRAWGRSISDARRYARIAGVRFRQIRWPPGTAPNWQNRRFRGTASFVVELPAGRLSPSDVRRHAATVLRLAR